VSTEQNIDNASQEHILSNIGNNAGFEVFPAVVMKI
jgi:hypothetical protein